MTIIMDGSSISGHFKQTFHIVLKEEWLKDVVAFIKSYGFSKEQEIVRCVFEQFLYSDLRDSYVSPLKIPSNASKMVIVKPMVLQIVEVLNVAVSLYEQFRECTHQADDNLSWFNGDSDSTADAHQEDSITNRWASAASTRRMLRLRLSDGSSTMSAIEFGGLKALDDSCHPGIKIQLTSRVLCRKGMLLLNDSNCQVLGGDVAELCDNYERANWLASKLGIEMKNGKRAPIVPSAAAGGAGVLTELKNSTNTSAGSTTTTHLSTLTPFLVRKPRISSTITNMAVLDRTIKEEIACISDPEPPPPGLGKPQPRPPLQIPSHPIPSITSISPPVTGGSLILDTSSVLEIAQPGPTTHVSLGSGGGCTTSSSFHPMDIIRTGPVAPSLASVAQSCVQRSSAASITCCSTNATSSDEELAKKLTLATNPVRPIDRLAKSMATVNQRTCLSNRLKQLAREAKTEVTSQRVDSSDKEFDVSIRSTPMNSHASTHSVEPSTLIPDYEISNVPSAHETSLALAARSRPPAASNARMAVPQQSSARKAPSNRSTSKGRGQKTDKGTPPGYHSISEYFQKTRPRSRESACIPKRKASPAVSTKGRAVNRSEAKKRAETTVTDDGDDSDVTILPCPSSNKPVVVTLSQMESDEGNDADVDMSTTCTTESSSNTSLFQPNTLVHPRANDRQAAYSHIAHRNEPQFNHSSTKRPQLADVNRTIVLGSSPPPPSAQPQPPPPVPVERMMSAHTVAAVPPVCRGLASTSSTISYHCFPPPQPVPLSNSSRLVSALPSLHPSAVYLTPMQQLSVVRICEQNQMVSTSGFVFPNRNKDIQRQESLAGSSGMNGFPFTAHSSTARNNVDIPTPIRDQSTPPGAPSLMDEEGSNRALSTPELLNGSCLEDTGDERAQGAAFSSFAPRFRPPANIDGFGPPTQRITPPTGHRRSFGSQMCTASPGLSTSKRRRLDDQLAVTCSDDAQGDIGDRVGGVTRDQEASLGTIAKNGVCAYGPRGDNTSESFSHLFVAVQAPADCLVKSDKGITTAEIFDRYARLNIMLLEVALQKKVYWMLPKIIFVQAACRVPSDMKTRDGQWLMPVMITDQSVENLYCDTCPVLLERMLGFTVQSCQDPQVLRNRSEMMRRKARAQSVAQSFLRLDLILSIEMYPDVQSTPLVVDVRTMTDALNVPV